MDSSAERAHNSQGKIVTIMTLIIRTLVATVFIGIGFAGLILPILPGWLFFGFAAMILFPEAEFARRTAAWLERRFPWTRRVLHLVVR